MTLAPSLDLVGAIVSLVAAAICISAIAEGRSHDRDDPLIVGDVASLAPESGGLAAVAPGRWTWRGRDGIIGGRRRST